jgi:hypothetical protein
VFLVVRRLARVEMYDICHNIVTLYIPLLMSFMPLLCIFHGPTRRGVVGKGAEESGRSERAPLQVGEA